MLFHARQQRLQLGPVGLSFLEPGNRNHKLEPSLDPTEKLTIETPEQISLEFPLAGVGSRGYALCVDTLIQGIVVLVVFLFLGNG